jgi:antitoxin CptB
MTGQNPDRAAPGAAIPEADASVVALDARRRRLVYRATHRGTRENDILLGGFVAARIAGFTEGDLDALEAVLELPDPELADYLTDRCAIPPDRDSPMLRAIRNAAR